MACLPQSVSFKLKICTGLRRGGQGSLQCIRAESICCAARAAGGADRERLMCIQAESSCRAARAADGMICSFASELRI